MAALKAYKCNKIVLENEIVDGAIIVDENGRINKILKNPEECQKFLKDLDVTEVEDGCVIMAGIVDSHVHVNTPGRSDWEDFTCVTKAAAAGGVTTICDMPLNSIPSTTTLDNLRIKADMARDTVYVDVAFWGGVVPGNEDELVAMINAGVVGFKCFLCPSGVDEFSHVTEIDLENALTVLENTDSVLAFHAECDLNDDECLEEKCETGPENYNTYLSSRPPAMEIKALTLIAEMAKKYNARLHIVHMSAVDGVKIVENMKKNGVKITAETCPHYLTLNAETIPTSATCYKCAPPVRNMDNREELWKFIKEGCLDMIVSDHSPCTPKLKTSDFMKAWGGISSVQFGLSLIWNQAESRGLTLMDISRLMSSAPASLCSLKNKGCLKEGNDADFIIFDTKGVVTITEKTIYHKNKLTPYLGMNLKGIVLKTYVRGNLVYSHGKFSEKPLGQLLLK